MLDQINALIDQYQYDQALNLLQKLVVDFEGPKKSKKSKPKNVAHDANNFEIAAIYQKYAEVLIELDSDLELAKSMLNSAIRLFPLTNINNDNNISDKISLVTKYFSLAQLCNGSESVELYKTAIEYLQNLSITFSNDINSLDLVKIKSLLSSAYCALVELYTTDLCILPDAEQTCEYYINQAILLESEDYFLNTAEVYSTLTGFRIIQNRTEDAIQALKKALHSIKIETDEIIVEESKSADTNINKVSSELKLNIVRQCLDINQTCVYNPLTNEKNMKDSLELLSDAVDICNSLLILDDSDIEVLYLYSLALVRTNNSDNGNMSIATNCLNNALDVIKHNTNNDDEYIDSLHNLILELLTELSNNPLGTETKNDDNDLFE